MFTKKVLVSTLYAVGIMGAVAIPLPSFAQVEIQLNYGPPAPRYEVIPPSRPGYVWSGGHWKWNGRQHVWVAGTWQPARPGYAYHQPRWVERDGGGGWYYRGPRWDRDGDGIANRNDATPDGGVRRGDRDGDGVSNNRDRRPNDPTRR